MSADLPANLGADRNLLFGMLAFQLKFITRDALVAALHAWALDKARPLGQVLVDWGELPRERLALVEALVGEHLKQNGNSARQCLATLGPVRELAPELERLADPEIRTTLSTLTLAAVPPLPDGPHAPREEVALPTSAGARFRTLRLHARGGLGQVLVAEDEELHREVALKEIQAQYADDPASRNRFLLEAEITGRLEHPGIVPVYGLGRLPDGRPFYAMRLIKGESLEDAIRRFHEAEGPGRKASERALALRGLLRRFVDVCNAIAYAHSRGILHRDLKPSNVMLGPYGETLVVDWGLAKPTDRPEELPRPLEGTLRPQVASDSAPTQAGAVLGTPPYMSPEQAAGRLDEVGPASDVYSLGATLYCLLTGRAPFEGTDVADVLYRVRHGDFAPPHKVNRSVPPGLEGVCLKAMALKPAERYSSPRELADEVERWLADEPVRAYPEPWKARLGRWARRHRTLVAGGAALLLTAVVALTVGLVALGRKQRETDRQARSAREAHEQAEKSARVADEQRAVALETLKSVVEEIQGRLKAQEDRQEPLEKEQVRRLREELLERAVTALRRVARGADDSGEADHNMVRAQLDLGYILFLAGRLRQARQRYEQGRQVAEGLVRARPEEEQGRLDLSEALQKLGDVAREEGRPEEAAGLYRRALDLAEGLAREGPLKPGVQRNRYWAYLRLGDAEQERRRYAGAKGAYRKALGVGKALVGLGVEGARRDESVACSRLGDALARLGETEGAVSAYTEALKIDLALFRRDPDSARARRDLSVSYERLGDVHLAGADAEQALWAYGKSHKLVLELARSDPQNVRAQVELADAHRKLAEAYEKGAEPAKAQEQYEQALGILRGLAQGGKLKDLPRVAQKVPAWEGRLEWCQSVVRAVGDVEFAVAQPPGRAARLLYERARVLARQGKPAEAAATADRLAGLAGDVAGNLYEAACCCALCVPGVGRGKRESDLTAGEKSGREKYAGQALGYLEKARSAGYFKDAGRVQNFAKDRDFDALRGRADFRKFAAGVGAGE